MQLITTILFVNFIVLVPVSAMAYVGPGLGAGTIGIVLGILGSIFVALFAVLWLPLKRLWKKIKKSDQQNRTE